MIEFLNEPGLNAPTDEVDRPGWIPPNIVADWDPSPYAYQTEEELMPQGPIHDDLMTIISGVLPAHLKKFERKLWKDLFLLYRDVDGVKRRVGPDLFLAPIDLELPAGSWDLDVLPMLDFVGEVTSPDSRNYDLEIKPHFYHSLGAKRYLVIDGHDDSGRRSGEIVVHMWVNGRKKKPPKSGFFRCAGSACQN